jgi:hypothetical protein
VWQQSFEYFQVAISCQLTVWSTISMVDNTLKAF